MIQLFLKSMYDKAGPTHLTNDFILVTLLVDAVRKFSFIKRSSNVFKVSILYAYHGDNSLYREIPNLYC
mgnify:CR=1 FL=1